MNPHVASDRHLVPVRPRVGVRDLAAEAVAGVTQRPLRSVLTGLGAAIGVCAVVTVLGLTAFASAQVNARFDALRAREITVTAADATDAYPDADLGGAGAPAPITGGSDVEPLPAAAAVGVARIPGVVAAGFVGTPDLGSGVTVTSLPLGDRASPADGPAADVRSVGADAWAVLHPHVSVGRLYDAGHERRGDRVAVLGVGAASALGISRLDAGPAVFVDGVAFTVVGIVDSVRREPDLLRAGLLPPAAVAAVWTPSKDAPTAVDAGAVLLVETRLGAATVVAQRIPWVIDPAHPRRARVEAPPDPKALGQSVGHDLDVLSLALAAVSVLLGALGISNTMLVTVMERVHEIGLRRALGAGRGHIVTQFLVEASILGGAGGLVGSSIGIAVVVAVAVARDWTPVLAPPVVVLAPALGLVSGLVAGVFPAVRAARIQPADALRR
jgi:putative ABC transport system permease protein